MIPLPNLRMARDYAANQADGMAVEPESRLDSDANRERDEDLDVATIAAEVGGFQPDGDIVSFLAKFYLDMDRISRMAPPLRVS